MSAQHTPARMKFVGNRGLRDADGKLFAVLVGDNFDQMEGDARRLAACWNACEGISTESLERSDVLAGLNAQRAQLTAQRDDLLAALRVFAGAAFPVANEINQRGHNWSEVYLDQALAIALAAMAKVEGGAT